MAYTKVLRVCQDFAFGYRNHNLIRANIDQIRTDLDVAHVISATSNAPQQNSGKLSPGSGQSTAPWQTPSGVHDDILNPRGVLFCDGGSVSAGNTSTIYTVGPQLMSVGLALVKRHATGLYEIQSSFFSNQFHAVVQSHTSSISDTRFGTARFQPNTTGYAPSFFYVALMQESSGDFVLADYPFSLTFYARS